MNKLYFIDPQLKILMNIFSSANAFEKVFDYKDDLEYLNKLHNRANKANKAF
jgi:hypothetical protein